jgi:hypothetical protein
MTVSLTLNEDVERASHATYATADHEPEAAIEAPTHEPESNYVSPGALMLWLATKTDRMYGELRQAMHMSEERSSLARALKDLQTLMEDGDATGAARLDAVEAVLESVQGTELEADVRALLEPMQATLDDPELAEASILHYNAAINRDRGQWAKQLESFVSDLDHQDKLALITIQQVVGEIRDATQLASNLIASEHDATTGVIGNIRA